MAHPSPQHKPSGLAGHALRARWHETSALVADLRDVIDERPAAGRPGWATARGWASWLEQAPTPWLEHAERHGAWRDAKAAGAPADLAALLARIHHASALHPLLAAPPTPRPQRGVKARKRHQLAAFAQLVSPLAGAVQRVVDVGAGHGHLTRELAEALAVDGLGLEREVRFVQAAQRWGAGRPVQFEAVTLSADSPSPIRAGDLVVGLHACGALTDTLTEHAARAGAAAVWISCCLHRVPGELRAPRCCPPELAPAQLSLPRARLGLANLALGAPGVEVPLAQTLTARAQRVALWVLLRGRGLSLPEPGDAMRGLNRRMAHLPFADFAAAALTRRGLPPATPAELAAAEAHGARVFDLGRRYALARKPIGRLLEVHLNLERAVWLQDRGYQVELGTAWPLAVSPRNVVGRARPG